MGPLLKERGDLVTWDSENEEVQNVFFAWVFTSKIGLQEFQVPEARLNRWSKEDVPLVEEDQVWQYLSKLDPSNLVLNNLQGRGIHNFRGQLCPVPYCPLNEEFHPNL